MVSMGSRAERLKRLRSAVQNPREVAALPVDVAWLLSEVERMEALVSTLKAAKRTWKNRALGIESFSVVHFSDSTPGTEDTDG